MSKRWKVAFLTTIMEGVSLQLGHLKNGKSGVFPINFE